MICIPVTSATHREALAAVKKSCRRADAIELRMDLIQGGKLSELITAARRNSDSVKIIVTCRRADEAVRAGAAVRKTSVIKNAREKKELLQQAIAEGADFIDIELAEGAGIIRALKALCAEKGSKTGIIVSYHDTGETPSIGGLKSIFRRCVRLEPDVVKIVATAQTPEDNLTILTLIPFAVRQSQKIIAFCMGEQGRISRLMAPLMGSWLSFAALEREARSAPGQYTVEEMHRIGACLTDRSHRPAVDGAPLSSQPQYYVLLGNPVAHSLSPLMHNAALAKMGIAEQYSAYCVQDVGRAMEGIRGMNIRGASVTIPFKETVMAYLDDLDDDALRLGAVNTIVNDNGHLRGCNTDWLGIVLTLKKAITIKNKTFAVVGAGGTARAAVYGILREGGFPVIFNRTEEKGKKLADTFGVPAYPLARIRRFQADCLINTTSVGMYPRKNNSPVTAYALAGYRYVMDVIYNPLRTKLLSDAEKRGCVILSGADMFVHQGAEQLRIWTGKEPPRALMKKIILKRLTAT